MRSDFQASKKANSQVGLLPDLSYIATSWLWKGPTRTAYGLMPTLTQMRKCRAAAHPTRPSPYCLDPDLLGPANCGRTCLLSKVRCQHAIAPALVSWPSTYWIL